MPKLATTNCDDSTMAAAEPVTISVSTIEDRLQSHSRAFTSLLELIPAKYYYGDKDNTRQWNKRKQTKAQNVIAKRARLDPDALCVELEPEPVDKQKGKFKNKAEKKEGRKQKRSSTINTPVIATGKGGGGEGDDRKGIEEAREIALDNFTFTTGLDASSSPPTTSTSDKKHATSATTATGAECATTRKADRCARPAPKIQGHKEKRGGNTPSPTISTNKPSKRKNAGAKKRKKDQKRQKACQYS